MSSATDMGGWRLVLHGGAKEIRPEEAEAHRRGCLRALACGRAILERGGSALDAVEATVCVLEDDPTFNAGTGSVLNVDGEVEMCAAMMDGADLSVGAVGIIRGVRNPVKVARRLLKAHAILLAGEGALRFAREQGLELCEAHELALAAPVQASRHDTVGAVALDLAGNLAAAASTGGLPGKPVGRMGDTALPGCGYYADNRAGALAFSGDGEAIARLALASAVLHDMREADPRAALERGLSRLVDLDSEGGGIAISAAGDIGWWHNSPHFAVASATAASPDGQVWLSRDEA